MENLLFNKKLSGHQELYYGQGMALIILPIRSGEAMESYLLPEVNIRGGIHSHLLSQTVNTSVLERMRTQEEQRS